MCVIIVKQKGKTIDPQILKNAGRINPDGLGVVWLDNFKITYHKSKEYKVLDTNRPFIAHFRYATVGKVGLSNTHPFQCGSKKDEWLMMNGTIKGLGNANDCDSKVLANTIGDVKRSEWKSILEPTNCRFVTANTKRRTYEIYNKSLWTKHDGVWFSKADVIETHYVAVYGTLKRGHGNHNWYLGDSTFIGKGKTKDRYPLIVSGLPYLIENKGQGHNVEVEVYRVSDSVLKDTDRLEGHPTWYCRKQVPIMVRGQEVMCWVYFNKAMEVGNNKMHKRYEREYTKPKQTQMSFVDDGKYNWWSTQYPADSPFTPKAEKVTVYYEDEMVDDGEMVSTKPVCVSCFHDLEHDLFNNYHCMGCDAWYNESEILKP